MATLLERIRAIRVMGGHFRLFFGDVDSGVRADRPSLDEAEDALRRRDEVIARIEKEDADVAASLVIRAETYGLGKPPADLTARVTELEALVREGGQKLLRSAYNDDCALGAKLLQAVNGPPPPAEMGDC